MTNTTRNSNSIVINHKDQTLTISKSFDKQCNIYGSEAFNTLAMAQERFPNYRVVIRGTHKKTLKDKITMKDIEIYMNEICKDETLKAEFKSLKAENNVSIFEKKDGANFIVIKEWFFNSFPEIDKKGENRKKEIDEIREKALQRRIAYEESQKKVA